MKRLRNYGLAALAGLLCLCGLIGLLMLRGGAEVGRDRAVATAPPAVAVEEVIETPTPISPTETPTPIPIEPTETSTATPVVAEPITIPQASVTGGDSSVN